MTDFYSNRCYIIVFTAMEFYYLLNLLDAQP